MRVLPCLSNDGKKEGKGAEEIKDEEEKYMQREWKQRFGNWSKNEWIQKYNVLQGQLIADYLKKA